MAVQKILALINGIISQYTPIQTSAGAGSAGAIPALNAAGQIDSTMLPASNSISFTASEAIAAGALINLWSNAGTINIRNADQTATGKQADGYAPSAIASAATGTVVLSDGLITGLSGLTVGSQYWLGTAGGVTTTPPSTAGYISQYVGKALTTTELDFVIGTVVNV